MKKGSVSNAYWYYWDYWDLCKMCSSYIQVSEGYWLLWSLQNLQLRDNVSSLICFKACGSAMSFPANDKLQLHSYTARSSWQKHLSDIFHSVPCDPSTSCGRCWRTADNFPEIPLSSSCTWLFLSSPNCQAPFEVQSFLLWFTVVI